MVHLIDKDALVAEIEKRKSQFISQADNFHSLGMEEKRDHFAVLASNMHSILSFLDTLEVKEVDLKKELNYDDYMSFFEEHPNFPDDDWGFDEAWIFAKYFFELGLKAQKGEEL